MSKFDTHIMSDELAAREQWEMQEEQRLHDEQMALIADAQWAAFIADHEPVDAGEVFDLGEMADAQELAELMGW